MCDAQYANMENKSSIHHEALTYINQIEALYNKRTALPLIRYYDVMCVCCAVCECVYLWLLIRLLLVGCINYHKVNLGMHFIT